MKDTTDITIILDRSGSMQAIRTDTIGGFNSFLEEQKKLPDKASLSLIQFDHEYEPVYRGIDIQDAAKLTLETFVPRGNTALYDAVGRTIVKTGERLAKLPEAERPKRVLFLIITDGAENASREYSAAMLHSMITEQREKYAWEFVFLGANQDSFLNAQQIGVALAANFVADAQGTHSLYSNVSGGTSDFRSGKGYTI